MVFAVEGNAYTLRCRHWGLALISVHLKPRKTVAPSGARCLGGVRRRGLTVLAGTSSLVALILVFYVGGQTGYRPDAGAATRRPAAARRRGPVGPMGLMGPVSPVGPAGPLWPLSGPFGPLGSWRPPLGLIGPSRF